MRQSLSGQGVRGPQGVRPGRGRDTPPLRGEVIEHQRDDRGQSGDPHRRRQPASAPRIFGRCRLHGDSAVIDAASPATSPCRDNEAACSGATVARGPGAVSPSCVRCALLGALVICAELAADTARLHFVTQTWLLAVIVEADLGAAALGKPGDAAVGPFAWLFRVAVGRLRSDKVTLPSWPLPKLDFWPTTLAVELVSYSFDCLAAGDRLLQDLWIVQQLPHRPLARRGNSPVISIFGKTTLFCVG